VSNQVL